MSTLAKLRSFHVADMAVFDWIATAVGAAAIATLVDSKNVIGIFIIMVIAAIIIHHAVGVPTMLNAYLGLAKKDDVYAARAKAVGLQ